MSNQLDVLQTAFPYAVLFPKNCDLSVKPPASCVPALILRGVSMPTSNRKTVAKVPDDGNNRQSSSSAAASQTVPSQINNTGIKSAAVAGIVIGSFVFGVITFVAFLFLRRHRIAQAKSLKSLDANPYPKGEGPSGRSTKQMIPWVARGDENVISIENPSPGLQEEAYQTPPTPNDHSSNVHSQDKQE